MFSRIRVQVSLPIDYFWVFGIIKVLNFEIRESYIMPKIILIPTSHIARESLEQVRETIEKEKPDCVAVELDVNRYYYLEKQGRENAIDMLRLLGLPTFLLYWILRKFQDYFGEKTGIFPGSEMVKAVEIAKEKRLHIALIDQPIQITLLKIRRIPLPEKAKLLWLLIKSIFGLVYPFGEKVRIDLEKVPPKNLIAQAMNYFRKGLPNFYRVLVSERNEVMARNLKELGKRFEKIVCVIGAGHEEGIRRLLKRRYGLNHSIS